MIRRKRILIMLSVILFFVLWFSHLLPVQVSKAVAVGYLSTQEDGDGYHITGSDYSGPFGSYFVYFENATGKKRNIGVHYRYLPFDVWFDSDRTRG